MSEPGAPTSNGGAESRAKLFLSYSRRDHAFVERLRPALEARGHEIWIDLQDIRPSEEWLAAIRAAIEGADAFIFVVSPDSVGGSSVCRQEIDHAVAHNKRVIPIVCRTVDTRTGGVPEPVAKLNWVFCRDEDDFDRAINGLVSALETDLDWLKQHTRLLERAVEWDAATRDDSFLLQKNDLAAAERWLTLGPTKEPKPTALQTEYIVSSRTSSMRRQRRTQAALAAGLVVTAGLAVLAWLQRNEAVSQSNIALSRQLTAQAQVLGSERPDLLSRGVLLAMESLSRYPTLDADQFLRQALPLLPRGVGSALTHRGPIQAVAFSPDGTRVATASWDGTANMWDAATGRSLFVLKAGAANQRIDDVTFSPNGARLATVNGSGAAQVWNAADGQPAGMPIQFRSGPGNTLSFSPDGRYLVTVSDGGADVWDVSASTSETAKVFATSTLDMSGKVLSPGSGGLPCSPLSSFVFSPDGHSAAIACRGQVMFLDVAAWRIVAIVPYQIRPGLGPPLHPIAFSADGKYLASADEVYDAAAHTLVVGLHAPVKVAAVAFSHDGEYVALATGDTVRVAQRRDGTQVAELRHARAVRAIAFHPTGQTIATAAEDNTARVWSIDPPRELTRIGHNRSVSCLAFSPDGTRLTTGSEDGTARIWQVIAQPPIPLKRPDTDGGSVVAVSADGAFMAVEEGDAIQVRDAVNHRNAGRVAVRENAASNLKIAQATLSADGRYLWASFRPFDRRRGRSSGAIQSATRLWDVSTGKDVASIASRGVFTSAAFSPDARFLVLDDQSDDQRVLRLWDVTRAREVAHLQHGWPAEPAFSDDGRYLAIVDRPSIIVLEPNTLREIRRLTIGDAPLRVVAFSPDGRLVAGGSNEAVEIWETSGGTASRRLPVASATAILFSPNGRLIATANWSFSDPGDRTVRIWEADTLREIGQLPILDVERARNVDVSPTRLVFSRDSRHLAAENQGLLRLWDVVERREIERWETGYSTQLAFDATGKYLLSGHDTSVAVWQWGPLALVADACQRLDRTLTSDEWHSYLGDEPPRTICGR